MHLRRISLTALITLLSTLSPFTPNVPAPLRPLQVLAQTQEARKVEADRLLNQGREQFKTSQFRAALQSWEQGLTIYREIGDRRGEGNALGNLGTAYFSLGDYAKAIDYYQQTLAILREIGDRLGEGQSLGGLGIAYYGLGDYAEAIDYHQQSLAIKREIGDRLGEGQSLGNLGIAYYGLGDYAKAIDYHQQSLAILREIGVRLGESQSLGNLGSAYNALGDYAKAIDYHQQSLVIAQEIGNHRGEGASLSNLGSAYNALGDYAKAIDYYQQSLAILREIGDRLGESQSLGNLGIAYYFLGDYAKAMDYQQQSLVIAQEIGDRLGEATSLGNLGIAYSALRDYAKAIDYHQQRLVIAREIGDRLGEGTSLGNLGNAYYALGNYAKAIDYQQQSLAIAREIGNLDGEGYALNGLGFALFGSGDLTEAEKNFREAIAVRESIRARLGSDDTNKVSIADTEISTLPYRNLQRVLIAQNNPSAALEISERGRARAFVELLAQRFSPSGAQAITPRQTSIEPPTIQQIQQIASQQNATLVQYSIVFDQLYIWVVQPTGEIAFRSVNLNTLDTSLADAAQGANLAAATGSIRGSDSPDIALTSFVRGTRQDVEVSQPEPLVNSSIAANSNSASSRLKNRRLRQSYQLLIEPIADLLPTNPEAHVIFIPQGPLFLIPFPALQDEQGKYLIEKHTILTAPSIQVLNLTRQARQSLPPVTQSNVLVVGNPTMPTLRLNPDQPPQALSPLPGAEQEALAIAELLKTQPLIGNAATEAAIVQQLPQARSIHLATHGLLDEVKSLNLGIPGAIALAPGNSQDGLLTSSEILNLNLKAELVVLSACDTGQGKITGDGVIGLSRAFISAGVPSVVVSLWAVPDAPTANLMTEFYRQMQRNPDKAQALRSAMLTTMQQHPEPKDWAAFTLIGEP
jgi:CHAT domain-containing protein/Tfp pilus assembly protein PilF